ncbi:MAG: hypothetical protein MUO34_14890 [Ignavibacteriaceae bacterium]|nr:hypothetical protein [Ignavibacteriaceae bacterium]
MFKTILNMLLFCFVLLSCADNAENHIPGNGNSENEKVFPSPETFYFVGNTELNPGVYKYNFSSKKSTIFWNSRSEKVIDLINSEDFKTTFFITAKRYGIAGSFPFVKKAKLYRIDAETKEISLIRDLGNAIQIYAFWSDEGNFNLTINSFDPKINTYIIQNKQLYNQFGKILTDQSETFDLLISGYPKFKLTETKSTFYNGRYKIFSVSDSIFVRDQKNKKKIFLKETDHKINEVEWIPGKSLFVYSTLIEENKNSTETASLNIFNIKNEEILKTFSGLSLYRFAITSDFLIFDSGFKINSKIHIINLTDLHEYDKINIAGGCGLRNIPDNPFL